MGKEPARIARNKERLGECFPTFAKRVADVIAEMEAQGFRPRIQDAHRTIAQQLEDHLDNGTTTSRSVFTTSPARAASLSRWVSTCSTTIIRATTRRANT